MMYFFNDIKRLCPYWTLSIVQYKQSTFRDTNKKPSSNIVVTYVLYVNFRTKHYYIEKSNMNVIDVQTIYYLGILNHEVIPTT